MVQLALSGFSVAVTILALAMRRFVGRDQVRPSKSLAPASADTAK
jgi:hypothetical protein